MARFMTAGAEEFSESWRELCIDNPAHTRYFLSSD